MNRHKGHKEKRRWNQRYFFQVVCLLIVALLLGGNQEVNNEKIYQEHGVSVSEESIVGLSLETKEMINLQQSERRNIDLDDSIQKNETIVLGDEIAKEEKRVSCESSIKGAYFTSHRVSNRRKVDEIIHSLEGTGINAVVIDIKNDSGNITFTSENALATKINAVTPVIWNISEMVEQFHEAGIYVIGRIVAFRDPILTAYCPKYAILDFKGNVYYDRANDAWLNPYHLACWDYLIEIAMEAANSGLDEIQFDYVRFSTEAKEGNVSFGVDIEEYTKTQVITDFMKYAVQMLHQKNVKVSADVFGTIINSEIDAKTVGQDYVELARYLDYICPMVYPSHYANGCYGIKVPDLQPYELIVAALNDSYQELLSIDTEYHCAIVRPWLQDFTASWKAEYQKYGVEEVTEQIQGVYDSGYQEWLLWNSSGRYSFTATE